MKIYVAHSGSYDFKQELYLPLRNSSLNKIHEITLPHENSSEPYNSKEFLKDCDLVIAEVSFPSTGEGIELGWADFYTVPVICIYKTGTKPSSSLKVVSSTFIEYQNPEDMIEKLTKLLPEKGKYA